MENSWDNVRARHETLPKNSRSFESASKNSGITSSQGKRDTSATRRMLMGIREYQTQRESTDEHLSEEKARLCRSTVARLNCWAVDRPDLQHAVRVCSKAAAKPTADDQLKLKRVGRYVKESPHNGIMFAWRPTKLTVQSDWARERKTRKKCVVGQHLFWTPSSAQLGQMSERHRPLWRGRAVRSMHGCATGYGNRKAWHENKQSISARWNCK